MLSGISLSDVQRLDPPQRDTTQLEAQLPAAAAARAAAAPTAPIPFNSRIAAALRACAACMRLTSARTRILLLMLLVLVVALLRRRFENIARALQLLWRYRRR